MVKKQNTNRTWSIGKVFLSILLLLTLTSCAVAELPPPEIPEAVPMDVPSVPDLSEETETAMAEEPTEEPAETPAEEPAEMPTEEPVQEPAEEPAEQPSETTEYPTFPEEIQLACGQAFIYDMDKGGIVAMKGAGEKLYPASITKLLTILTALQYVDTDQLITPGDEQSLVAADSSIAYVNSTHVLTAEQLIEGMLLPSGNDAACALAAAVGRNITGDQSMSGVDAVNVCVEAMNDYAADLGMTGSHFVTVDGYLDENHYSTIEDMARLSVAAAQNEVIRKYCGLASDDVTYYSGHTIHWTNSNLMLDPESQYYSPYVTGMKTGSLTGHFSLVCTLEKDGKTYVAGVFTGQSNEDRYGDMTTIVNWLFGGTGDD